ncbi:autoinducer 2 ABC transporter substrate-binding protein [Nocardioides sp. LHG3406-4]|uniref:autoinducer 2 ABC transporter substrate-binding protein n=1 Tax=Nocardioides sp. LHG3406-4 TaxID=2804575 RepID=UPI003CF37954
MMKRTGYQALVVGAATLALAACSTTGGSGGAADTSGDLAPEDMSMVTVVKLTGVGWFDRMEEGVNAFADRTGIDARQQGADDASPEKQIQIIQDLLPQNPTAITVVPNSPEALENVLASARKQGVVVVSHEAAGMENVDADIEAFDNDSYGRLIGENLADCMGGKGQYAAFVGGLTAKTHMDWVAGGLAYMKENAPGITRVSDPIESKEDEGVAYDRAKEILAKYPDIKGFQGSAGTDVAGIARAVQEAGKQDSICVMGTSIPSVAKKYLADGSIDKAFLWDPALAGEAQLAAAELIAQGKKIEEGTDLGVKGYESLKPIEGTTNAFSGEATLIVDKDNVDDFDF